MPRGCVLFDWLGDWAERLQGFLYSFSFVNIKRSSPPVGAKGNCRKLAMNFPQIEILLSLT